MTARETATPWKVILVKIVFTLALPPLTELHAKLLPFCNLLAKEGGVICFKSSIAQCNELGGVVLSILGGVFIFVQEFLDFQISSS